MLVLFALSASPYFPFIPLIVAPSPSSGSNLVWAIIFFTRVFSVLQAVLLATGLIFLYAAILRSGVLGPWRSLLPVIGILTVGEIALWFVKVSNPSTLSEAVALVSGMLWVVLAVAIWRHAPPAGQSSTNTALINP
jgi:hypothetical protein